MVKKFVLPDFIFESSWEVCNQVGGIYTVLSTRANTLQQILKDRIIFIGPDCWADTTNPFFKEDNSLLADWQAVAAQEDLQVRVGRWLIPGQPIAVLIDFKPFFACKNDIYVQLWNDFKVDGLHAYGDYDEASMFSYAAAKVVESFYHYQLNDSFKVVYHGNEWMTGLGLLYIQKHVPQIATVFTTHATSIGRSIAGNNKPLYEYLFAYRGDQMAEELNMQSKHSIEKQTALHVDCFTTVSDITAKECQELLDKPVDIVLPNGFEDDFVPKGATFTARRQAARRKMLKVASALLGETFDNDTLILSTSGRYEFRNKGIDVFIEAMNRLKNDNRLSKKILAFIDVPAWMKEPRQDLQERLSTKQAFTQPLENPMLTHWLNEQDHDKVLGMMKYLGFDNHQASNVKLIFVPCYLTGQDGIFNISYYDLILGNDLCVYPSYYEPWGYTPLEAVAFKVPCITTDLAGFGLWAEQTLGRESTILDGVKVIHRTDYNFSEVADSIKEIVIEFSLFDKKQVEKSRSHAFQLSKKTLWKHFIKYYEAAYDLALSNAQKRLKTMTCIIPHLLVKEINEII